MTITIRTSDADPPRRRTPSGVSRAARGVRGFGLALCAFALGAVAPGLATAQNLVVGFDGAPTDDFEQGPYFESNTMTRVLSGHYEIIADAVGQAGDLALNLDEQNLGLSKIRIIGAGDFDALQFEVVNPADSIGEFMITAIGGSGTTIPAPTVAGPFVLGPAFQGIQALEITQIQPGAFAIDDLELVIVPEPGFAMAVSLTWVALVGVSSMRGRREGVRRSP